MTIGNIAIMTTGFGNCYTLWEGTFIVKQSMKFYFPMTLQVNPKAW